MLNSLLLCFHRRPYAREEEEEREEGRKERQGRRGRGRGREGNNEINDFMTVETGLNWIEQSLLACNDSVFSGTA